MEVLIFILGPYLLPVCVIGFLLAVGASYLSSRHRHQSSMDYYVETFRRNPQSGVAYADRALTHARAGNAEQARRDVESAVALGAGDRLEEILKR